MPSSIQTRSAYVYAMYGHSTQGSFDYKMLLQSIYDAINTQRQVKIDETTAVAIMSAIKHKSGFIFRIITWKTDSYQVLYNTSTGEEEFDPDDPRISGNPVYAFFDPETRLALIENRRPGISIAAIEDGIQKIFNILNESSAPISFRLTEVADISILREFESYQRIREAGIYLTQPNPGWSDCASPLAGYAEESNAETYGMQMKAYRGESLKKEGGIVSDIKNFLLNPLSGVKQVFIRGQKENDERETTLSLKRHRISYSVRDSKSWRAEEKNEAFARSVDSMLKDKDDILRSLD